MRVMRFSLIFILTGILAIVVSQGGSLLAFHDGGVAHCNRCHTMHNSQDGVMVDPDATNGNAWLLTKASPSDVCLECHATGLGAVFSADPLAPDTDYGAGNFVFLTEDNINDGHAGGANPILGQASGHNIVSPGKMVIADTVLTTAPGGTFPSSLMACTSCHDPHGTQAFRMLYGAGREIHEAFTFLEAAPVAVGLPIFGGGESPTSHTAYQSGMSAWCGNCHGDFHDNSTMLIHPSGSAIGGSIANTYNLYNGTDDQTGGTQPNAYLPEVPFQDQAPTNTTSSTAGPSASSQVMCLTCHRAHATSSPDAGRWDFNVTFLHEDGEESGSYAIPDPYANVSQRSLCNKCHNQDEFDAPFVPSS